MAITRYAGDRFVGLDSEKESLLTRVMDGALYLASDQNKQYVKKDGSWIQFGGSIDGSGISGYVARWGDEDTLTSGLIFDDGISGVGINTTSPQHALHISGDAQISGYLYDSQNSTGEAGYILASEEGGPQWKQIEDVLSGVGGSGAANYVARWADEDTLTTGVLVDNGTNVGINVPSPNFPLEISSSGNATIRIEDTTNTSRLDLRAEDSAVLIRSTSNFPMRFDVNQTERMRIDIAGKVGIGTVSPNKRLEVVDSGAAQILAKGWGPDSAGNDGGAIQLGEEAAFHGLFSYDNATSILYIDNAYNSSSGDIRFRTKTSGTAITALTIEGSGYVGIGTTSPNAKLEILSDGSAAGGAEIRLTHANNISTDVVSTLNFANSIGSVAMIQGGTTGANNTGYISFFTDNAGTSSEKVRIIGNGNVGIGTVSPSAKLHVKEAASGLSSFDGTADTLILESNANGGMTIVTAAANTGRIIFASPNDSTGAEIKFSDATDLMTIGTTTPNADLALQAGNGAEAVRILDNGNVGIGTASPVTELHLYTDTTGARNAPIDVLTLETEHTSDVEYNGFGQGIVFRGSTYNQNSQRTLGRILHQINDSSINTTRGTSMSFQTSDNGSNANAPTTKVTIDYKGDVGIGTVTPGSKLHVIEADTGEAFRVDGASAGFAMIVEGGTSYKTRMRGGVTIGNGYGASTPPANGLIVEGSVGIGIVPLEKLHVAGSTLISNNNYHYGYTAAGAKTTLVGIKSNNYVTVGQLNANNVGTDIYGGTGNIYLYSGSTNRLTVSSDVNVQGATDLQINGPSRGLNFTSGTGTVRTTTSNKLFLQTNSTDALTIDASQNVGIGTTAPGYKLDVAGNARVTTDLFVNDQLAVKTTTLATSNNFHVSSGTIGSASKSSIALVSVADDSTFSSGVAALHVINSGNRGTKGHSSGSDLLRLEFSNSIHTVFDKDGHVGIGTTNPDASLDIRSASGSVGLTVGNTTGNTRLQITSTENSDVTFNVGDASDMGTGRALIIKTGNSERMRIAASGGEVGIGTTNPQGTLDLGNATGGKSIVWGGTNGTNHYTSIWSEYGSGSLILAGGLKSSTTDSNFIYPYTGTYGYAAIELDSFHDDGIKFYTAADASRTAGAVATKQERMRIDPSGKVGIGTVSPDLKLHINNTGGSPNTRFSRGTGYIFDLKIDNIITNSAIDYIIEPNQASSGILFRTHNSSNTNINALAINRDGKVGIGTLNPTANLTVLGATGTTIIQALGADSNGFADVEIKSTGATGASRLFFSDTAAQSGFIKYNHSDNSMQFGTSASVKMHIDTSGQVQFNAYGSGTFTSTATQRLAVDSSGNIIEIPIGSGAVDGSGAANKVTYWTNTDTISYNNNFHWDNANGNLGVGTAAPSSTLHVSDSTSGASVLKVDGTSGTIFEVTDDLSSSLMSVNTIAGLPVFEVFADYHIVAGRYNQNDFYLDTNGNLGLGTSTPRALLDVSTTVDGDSFPSRITSTDGSFTDEQKLGIEFAQNAVVLNQFYSKYDISLGGWGFGFKGYSSGLTDELFTIGANGNVGLGATNPIGRLHIYQSGGSLNYLEANPSTEDASLGNIYGRWDGDNTSLISFRSGSDTTNKDNGDIAFYTSTADGSLVRAMTIDENQKVGIGNPAPGGKLEISNSGTNTELEVSTWSTTDSHNSFLRFQKSGSATVNTLAATAAGEDLGEIQARGVDTNSTARTAARILFQGDAAPDAVSVPGRIVFSTSNTSGLGERMRIDDDGYVGIGTDNPKYKLDVNAGLSAGGAIGYPVRVGHGSMATNGDGVGVLFSRGSTEQYFGYVRIQSTQSNPDYLNPRLEFGIQDTNTFNLADASTRMVIIGNGNVGINTVSPNYKLHTVGGAGVFDVTGAASLNHHLAVTEVATLPDWRPYAGSTTAALQIQSSATRGILLAAKTTGNQDFYNTDGLDIYVASTMGSSSSNKGILAISAKIDGNVGIGTPSAKGPLTVQSDTSADSITIYGRASDDGGDIDFFGYNQTTRKARIFIDSNGFNISGKASGASNLIIDSSGSVGIGTITPDAKLEVAGGSTGIMLSNLGDSSAYDGVNMTYSGYNSGTPEFIFQPTTTPGSGTINSFFRFKNRSSGGSNRANVTVEGSVGIGTSSPSQALSIVRSDASGSAEFDLYSTNSLKQPMLTFRKSASNTIGTKSVTPDGSELGEIEFIGVNTGSNFAVKSVSILGLQDGTAGATYIPGALTFGTGTNAAAVSERMRITSAGKVGIGAVSPNHELEVAGSGDATIRITSTSTSISDDTRIGTLQYFSSDTNSNTVVGEIVSRTPVSNFGNVFDIAFSTYKVNSGALSEKMRITGAGKVGIGTTEPGYKLDVDGAVAADSYGFRSDSTAKWYYFDTFSGSNFIGRESNTHTSLYDTGTLSMVWKNGKVGIGTANPLFKLHVNGDIFQDVGYSIYSNANRGWYRGNYVTTGSGVSNGKIVTLNPSHGQTASSNYHYIFELTTIGTATNTGATYIGVYSADASAWSLRAVSLSGDSSNHPQLSVSGNNFTVYTNHSSNYTVVVSVTSVYNGDADSTAHSLGANYQWQRAVNDLYYNDGNVGIGTNAPGGKLHVYGGTTAFTNLSDNTDSVQITRSTSVHSHPDAKLFIYDNSNSDYAQKIDLAGYSYGLRIEGFVDYGLEIHHHTLGLVLVARSSELVINDSGNDYNFRVEGETDVNLLVCDASVDRVGIGTASPSQKLDVIGRIRSSFNSGDYFEMGSSDNGGFLLGFSGTTEVVNVRTYGDSYFNGGNVGIGIAVPSQKLHVQGTFRLTGAFYDSNNAAGTSGQVLTSTGSATDWKTLDEISGVTALNPTTTNYVTKWSNGTNEVITDSIIQDNGNIGIGVAPANGYKLKVDGNGYFSGTLTEASSLAIKENIENFTPSIDKINKIRPVKYNKKGSDKKEIGLIAEELEELFPELVEKDENGNPSGVNYSRAVTVLLGGFKELYKELQEIKKRI